MKLTDAGEGRIRGYLFVLERSLRSFLPRDMVTDAVREVETHVRERIDQADAMPNEAVAIERILQELGTPLRVAQAYSSEITLDEAVTTGRLVPVLRALYQTALTTATAFVSVFALLVGYLFGVGFVIIAAMKPIFPDDVGFKYRNGELIGFGADFSTARGIETYGGYWIVPVSAAIGLLFLLVTHRAARAFLGRMRRRLAERRDRQAITGAGRTRR